LIYVRGIMFLMTWIKDDQTQFYNMPIALPVKMILQVIDIVDTMQEAELYNHFKTQLLEVHQLSDYDKFDVLMKMKPFGG
jgi:hypothetical protein